MMNSISEEQFYQLLSLKLSGDATSDDLALLQEQLSRHPEWQFLYDQMMNLPATLPDARDHTSQAYAAHITKMQLQGMLEDNMNGGAFLPAVIPLPGSSHRRKMLPYIAAAASVIVVVVGAGLWKARQQPQPGPRPFNEVVTQKGSRSNIKLPDGTQVWLNADSKLTYGENFSEANREVSLVGEAYFDVGHDGEHPFIIHAGKESIKVLGTAFNVRNYPEDKFLETTLMRGKIEIAVSGRPNESIILKPYEKLTFSKEKDSFYKTDISPLPVLVPIQRSTRLPSAVVLSKKDSIIVETAWLLDKMVFINERLGKIALELERHFAITVIFKNPKVEEFRYTGVFDNISLEKILQILKESKKITYQISGKNLTIE